MIVADAVTAGSVPGTVVVMLRLIVMSEGDAASLSCSGLRSVAAVMLDESVACDVAVVVLKRKAAGSGGNFVVALGAAALLILLQLSSVYY